MWKLQQEVGRPLAVLTYADPPTHSLGSVSQFQGHSCSRAWGELAPYCAPASHTPPVHLHPQTFPPLLRFLRSFFHPSTLPPAEGPLFPLALIMNSLQIMWFIFVTGRLGVKLVRPVHCCYFNSPCMWRRKWWQVKIYFSDDTIMKAQPVLCLCPGVYHLFDLYFGFVCPEPCRSYCDLLGRTDSRRWDDWHQTGNKTNVCDVSGEERASDFLSLCS